MSAGTKTAKRRKMLGAIAQQAEHLGRNLRNLSALLAENMSELHGEEFRVCTCHDRGEEFILIRPLLASERAKALK